MSVRDISPWVNIYSVECIRRVLAHVTYSPSSPPTQLCHIHKVNTRWGMKQYDGIRCLISILWYWIPEVLWFLVCLLNYIYIHFFLLPMYWWWWWWRWSRRWSWLLEGESISATIASLIGAQVASIRSTSKLPAFQKYHFPNILILKRRLLVCAQGMKLLWPSLPNNLWNLRLTMT